MTDIGDLTHLEFIIGFFFLSFFSDLVISLCVNRLTAFHDFVLILKIKLSHQVLVRQPIHWLTKLRQQINKPISKRYRWHGYSLGWKIIKKENKSELQERLVKLNQTNSKEGRKIKKKSMKQRKKEKKAGTRAQCVFPDWKHVDFQDCHQEFNMI